MPLDLNLICYFNKLVLQNTERDYWAGRPRSTVNWQAPDDWSRRRAIVSTQDPGLAVADSKTGELLTHFPSDGEVGLLLDDLLEWVRSPEAQLLTPVERAAIFHHEFTRIHPFRDGNGRTARALMTLMLRREGFDYEVLVLQRILDERRTEYIAALRAADQGDLNTWIVFFVNALCAATQETARLISESPR